MPTYALPSLTVSLFIRDYDFSKAMWLLVFFHAALNLEWLKEVEERIFLLLLGYLLIVTLSFYFSK